MQMKPTMRPLWVQGPVQLYVSPIHEVSPAPIALVYLCLYNELVIPCNCEQILGNQSLCGSCWVVPGPLAAIAPPL